MPFVSITRQNIITIRVATTTGSRNSLSSFIISNHYLFKDRILTDSFELPEAAWLPGLKTMGRFISQGFIMSAFQQLLIFLIKQYRRKVYGNAGSLVGFRFHL